MTEKLRNLIFDFGVVIIIIDSSAVKKCMEKKGIKNVDELPQLARVCNACLYVARIKRAVIAHASEDARELGKCHTYNIEKNSLNDEILAVQSDLKPHIGDVSGRS